MWFQSMYCFTFLFFFYFIILHYITFINIVKLRLSKFLYKNLLTLRTWIVFLLTWCLRWYVPIPTFCGHSCNSFSCYLWILTWSGVSGISYSVCPRNLNKMLEVKKWWKDKMFPPPSQPYEMLIKLNYRWQMWLPV